MMMPDYPGGVTLFPAKNPRPGPDPGGGRANGSVVLGGGGGGNASLGQVHLNDRSHQQQTSYPRPLPPSGRLHPAPSPLPCNPIEHFLISLSLIFGDVLKKNKK